MQRRTLLGTATASTLAAISGCLGSLTGDGSTGTLATHVSDDPGDIADFESCVVTVTAIDVMSAAEDAKEPETIEVDDAEVDLTEVKNEKSQLVSEAELDAEDYEWLRVAVSDDVDATLADGGGDAEVKVPSNGLKMNKEFEIRADETTSFTADFTPVKRGQGSSYNIKPVSNEVTVTYESEGTGTGTKATSTTVSSEDGTDTTTG
ncbi:DUF4382 domain-containing protein [Halorubellus sp. JP-L1]|uniref:DUF4382 domain-containing protein n=1 Tax=Halorubellus sp. JP-L1 TaxID=2715753 RepID=UPI00140B20FA|nr:DUF4382 domain-containing protein [Halorubellus sp. JP-L1]NHN42654.1 DUF4382 domain-containing protein [Halorubellus sp. JP-L1]